MNTKGLQGAESDKSAVEDRRIEPRFPSLKTVTILPCASATHDEWKFVPALVEDISASGIGLIVSAALKPGDEFFIKLRHRGVVLAQYTVKYCRQSDPRRFRIGASLIGCVGSSDAATILECLKSE